MGALKTVVLMTGNEGKVKEIRAVLDPLLSVQVRSFQDFDPHLTWDETGDTFEANAAIKVNAFSIQPGMSCISDDSGLEVDALNGRPGIYSARYGGEGLSDLERCEALLQEMEGCQDRAARFRCVIAVKGHDQNIRFFSGSVEGHLALEPRGTFGFGYDCIFIPEGYSQTFGELGPDIKYGMSHRGKALDAMFKADIF